MANKSKLSVFGTKPKGTILVPTIPYNLRNDCQVGQWTNGQENLGDKLAMTIVAKFEWFGNLGSAIHKDWWQIWFVAEREGTNLQNLPFETVMVTYVKTESLGNLNKLVTTMMSDGEPAEKVILSTFIKKSTTLDDGKQANYWAITWNYRERIANDTKLESLAAAVQENTFIDSVGTAKMMPGTYASLVAAGKIAPVNSTPVITGGNEQKALPATNS